MRSRLARRRSATALGTYVSTAFGVAGTVVAARVLEPADFGRLALVIATSSFFQLVLDLTSEEALVKYGFRYSTREAWGRFRRLLHVAFALKGGSAVVAGLVIAGIAPLSELIFDADLRDPLLLAALLPLLQSLEGLAASVLVLRSRYDVRAAFLAIGTGLRLVAIVLLAHRGVFATVCGLVAAQATSTIAIWSIAGLAYRRFPRERAEPLAEDRRDIVRFVGQSSLGTFILSLRGWIAPVLLGVVVDVRQVGYFRAAQAPQQGFAALSSPVRLILLTEQTRDWERGRRETVLAGVRRYVVAATALMALVVPVFLWAMPALVRHVLGEPFTPATDAARVILIAAAVQLIYGWSKSFPVSIGRPGLRVVAYAVETAVLIPLLLVLGSRWGATGAAFAVLAAAIAGAIVWTVTLFRLRSYPELQMSPA